MAGYDRAMPWGYCAHQAISDQQFWKVEVEEAALLVLSRSSQLQDMVGGTRRLAVLHCWARWGLTRAPPIPRSAPPKQKQIAEYTP